MNTPRFFRRFESLDLSILTAFFLVSSGCSDPEFSSSTSPTFSPTAVPTSPPQSEPDSTMVRSPKDESTDSLVTKSETIPETESLVSEESPEETLTPIEFILAPTIGSPKPTPTESCQRDAYNVVLILDNSGSLEKNDPQLVRRQVSINFAKRFNSLVRTNQAARVQIAVVSFNTEARTFNWVRLDGKDDPAIDKEPIDTLTESIKMAVERPYGGTMYSPAFKAAGLSFSALGASRLASNVRNYAIFMSDGIPAAGDPYTPSGILKNFATPHNVAIMAIASGSSIGDEGAEKVRELGLPNAGLHQGKYYRANSSKGLSLVWDSVFDDLVTCK